MKFFRVLERSYGFALNAWRVAPLGLALVTIFFVSRSLTEGYAWFWAISGGVLLAQLLVLFVGLVMLNRGALVRLLDVGTEGPLVPQALRLIAAWSLSDVFVGLIALVLGLVIWGLAGATGLDSDFNQVVAFALSAQGWQAFTVLALIIASVVLLLSLRARLLPAGPASLAERRVAALDTFAWSRGAGFKPMLALVVAWMPTLFLALLGPYVGGWPPLVTKLGAALVMGLVQVPVIVGLGVALYAEFRPSDGVAEA